MPDTPQHIPQPATAGTSPQRPEPLRHEFCAPARCQWALVVGDRVIALVHTYPDGHGSVEDIPRSPRR